MSVNYDPAVHVYEFSQDTEALLNSYGFRTTADGDIEFSPICAQCKHYNGTGCNLLMRSLPENTPACTGLGYEVAAPF